MKQHKLIWDFNGPDAKQFAEHHARHLGEFVQMRQLENVSCDIQELNPMRWVAYMQGEHDLMQSLKSTLKPRFEAPVK